ncbi:MAG TPA: IS30 family transposase [Candidatus Anaerobutyricum stercoris]|uniref:IS30 family transposase n=1 Tax=Candidatus Anaerobutyricum stercoris TaxID=2838457 RepID=A0A9D2J847_9FIRM|nr:IS30 family transposase [Eubacterium sp. An11]OUQ67244.1 IS30 family transposase [Eubacterium sp. An11]CVI71536.1 Integrase core domain protein [Eubacteriaceae bacterium CHKCI004]HIZ40655.1 IS30 family transposase [Candidatus Anaerobutyricum stercoris]
MGEKWRQLKYEDRLQLDICLKGKMKVPDIAKLLHVAKTTIYREIKRGKFTKRNSDWTESEVYDPYVANEKYKENLQKRGRQLKIGNDLKYASYLEKKIIEDKYSPEAALVTAKRDTDQGFQTTICVNTLYSYIRKGIFLNLTMEDLPIRKKKQKKKRVKVQKRAQAGTSISLRPKHIDKREEFGNWEMDTVVGAQKESKNILLVLTERKTREEIIRKMKDKSAASVVRALDGLERKLGTTLFRKIFKTITVDNGTEFSDVKGIERSKRSRKKRTKLFFCHPYRSCERGSNENNNRLIRRHIPKGINFDFMPRTEIQYVEDWINNYPRKLFGFRSAGELFQEELLKLGISVN